MKSASFGFVAGYWIPTASKDEVRTGMIRRVRYVSDSTAAADAEEKNTILLAQTVR